MSWDSKKRGGKYLYLSRRVNGRTVKEYVGRGPIAEVIARQTELSLFVQNTATMLGLGVGTFGGENFQGRGTQEDLLRRCNPRQVVYRQNSK
jgi:hypothetical protein